MLRSRACLRAALPCTQSQSHFPKPSISLHVQAAWHARRVFATTPRHRKDESRTVQKEIQAKQLSQESIQPESVKPAKPAQPSTKDVTKDGALLAEQTVSNKEQRKMDWAIMKDMVQYLWPKNDLNTRFRVSLSLGLLIGAKVGYFSIPVLTMNSVDRFHVGPKCSSSFLLQGHCRHHEH